MHLLPLLLPSLWHHSPSPRGQTLGLPEPGGGPFPGTGASWGQRRVSPTARSPAGAGAPPPARRAHREGPSPSGRPARGSPDLPRDRGQRPPRSRADTGLPRAGPGARQCRVCWRGAPAGQSSSKSQPRRSRGTNARAHGRRWCPELPGEFVPPSGGRGSPQAAGSRPGLVGSGARTLSSPATEMEAGVLMQTRQTSTVSRNNPRD